MAGRIENQVVQWCGVDSTQVTEGVTEEAVKCVGDNAGSFFPPVSQSSVPFAPYSQTGEYAPRLTGHTQWASMDGMPGKSPNKDYLSQFTMSGGPPHNPHGRQAPPNSAWNHLQVPNYYPRQPQHAHMSSELPLLATHQPTWHTPTTEPSKTHPHNPLFNLQQMLSPERQFPRHSPGVDLTLTRNGNQNGDLPQTPISLSVRDAKQINSLPPSALEPDRAVELTKVASPSLQDTQKNIRKQTKRVDSILERLNPTVGEKPQSVIVTAASSSHDENSNSSIGTGNLPSTNREEEVVSPASTEDSLDSNKSRRKRKPNKTVKLPSKEDEPQVVEKPPPEPEKTPEVPPQEQKESPVRRRSSSEPSQSPPKSRRKTLSESETIDNIAAMVAATEIPPIALEPEPEPEPELEPEPEPELEPESTPLPQDQVDSKESSPQSLPIETVDIPSHPTVMTAAQKKGDQCFVAVEVELEKMFAGIADTDEEKVETAQDQDPLALPSTSLPQNENVSSTSNETNLKKRRVAKKSNSRRPSECNSNESTPRKKHKVNNNNKKRDMSEEKSPKKLKKVVKMLNKEKDVFSYDSGSNASSSRSRGPFIQIRGPRDSPLSVSIVNAPSNEEDGEKPKVVKNKKFHDDSEYRHKVRSKGLHCSTLSNKYDAQTRDVSWICVFCKRGPHATDPHLPGPSPFSLDLPHYSPGDLFGPYIISTDCIEYQRRIDDPYDALFKSKRSAMALLSESNLNAKNKKSGKKRQNSMTESTRDSIDSIELNKDVMLGIAEVTQNSYEVWVHEDCVTWSPNVYLVGPKIVGLEGAVWSACSVACKRCGLRGATVNCLRRGCGSVMHIGCAKCSNWSVDEQSYKAYCTEHRMP